MSARLRIGRPQVAHGRRRPARSLVAGVGALAISLGAVGCAGESARSDPSTSPYTATSTAAESPASEPAPAEPSLTTEPPPPTTGPPASPAPTSTTAAMPTSTTTAVPTSATPTTVGDLLTEAEVAEVERALDELDVLLGEIDADLADLPDP